MATIRKETLVDVPPEQAWAALADFGALHERLVPGFVVAAERRGDVRVITFFNGAVASERLVGVDDEARRLAYTVVDGPLGATYHHASAEVRPEPGGRCRFVWITDVLPEELAEPTSALMDRGIAVIKETLEQARLVS
jgi:polyketide cyclase/dehydrase/lipid transport protein